jgi:hypothetical protein
MLAASVVAAVFLLLIAGCLWSYRRCANDFDCGRGFADYFRIPLRYPYQIVAIDTLDDGCLNTWQGEQTCILRGISQYAVEGAIMVGRTGPTWDSLDRPEGWFSLNFDTGEVRRYDNREAFAAACWELGFEGEPALRSIREHYFQD